MVVTRLLGLLLGLCLSSNSLVLHKLIPSFSSCSFSSSSSASCPPPHSRGNAMIAMKQVKVGVVGLPNVGKSTLFNALAQKSIAQTGNFPFCTIEPNVAPVAVPDPYLEQLAKLAGSKRAVPAFLQWVDVAGLVKGASRGEGLGNKFLGTARECDCLCHVLRAFEDAGGEGGAGESIIHVEGRVDPVEDAEVVNLELILADLAHVERRLERLSAAGAPGSEEERGALESVKTVLQRGEPARTVGLSADAARAIKSLSLLTLKPVLYAFNVDEVDFTLDRDAAAARCGSLFGKIRHKGEDDAFVIVSAKLEEHLGACEGPEEREAFAVRELGMEPGELDFLPLSSYALPSKVARDLLGLSIAHTGPGVPPEKSQTTRAHLFRSHPPLTAAGLAGRIHGDIERGFLRAEVAQAADLLRHGSYADARAAGVCRSEGRDAELQNGDVALIKWK